MNWFGNGAKAWGVILASLVWIGASTPAFGQGFEDDFAQDWVSLETDASAIELAGCFSKAPAACDSACDMGCPTGCDSGCDSCCPVACCPPWWAHRSALMGQWLFLRPGDTDIVYTVEQNDLPQNSFPTGPLGINAIDVNSGLRVGFAKACNECSSWVGTYTYWRGQDSDSIDATNGNILVSEILHPSRLNAGAAGLQESSSYAMEFQLADLAFRHLWKHGRNYAINWKGGLQYGHMEQNYDFAQTVPASVAVGTVSVDSDINFDGFGLMAGLDVERHNACTGISVYGKGTGSALAGEWNATYRDTANQIAGGSIGNDYEDFRVTPLLELEIGFAWQSECGRARVNAGYMTSAWYNALSSRSYIDAVREGRFVDIDESITFNGLVLGGEYRF